MSHSLLSLPLTDSGHTPINILISNECYWAGGECGGKTSRLRVMVKDWAIFLRHSFPASSAHLFSHWMCSICIWWERIHSTNSYLSPLTGDPNISDPIIGHTKVFATVILQVQWQSIYFIDFLQHLFWIVLFTAVTLCKRKESLVYLYLHCIVNTNALECALHNAVPYKSQSRCFI